MIIKVPVYFEFDEQLTQDQVRLLIDGVQRNLTKDLKDVAGDKFKYEFFGRKIQFLLKTSLQVQSLISGPRPPKSAV